MPAGRRRLLNITFAYSQLEPSAGAEISGLSEHPGLTLLQQKLRRHRVSGLAPYVALFALGNLIQIPGWIFPASAVAEVAHRRDRPPPAALTGSPLA